MPKHAQYPGQLPTRRLESTKETKAKTVKELTNIRLYNFRARIISNHEAENVRVMKEMKELASYRYFGFHDFATFIKLEKLNYDFRGILKKEHN